LRRENARQNFGAAEIDSDQAILFARVIGHKNSF
jgi:hypothetical protein